MAASAVGDRTEVTNGTEKAVCVAERDTSASIYQRVLAIMSEVGFLEKDKIHEIRKEGKKLGEFPYISHDAVTAHIRSGFVRHGVLRIPTVTKSSNDGNRTELEVTTAFVNVDKPGDRIEIQTVGYGIDRSDKGPGKALSYAVKTAELKLFMLNSVDDIEKDSTAHDPDKPRVSQQITSDDQTVSALKVWANNFKMAIENAPDGTAIDGLQKKNKQALMDAPETTRQYFIDMIERRKQQLGEGSL